MNQNDDEKIWYSNFFSNFSDFRDYVVNMRQTRVFNTKPTRLAYINVEKIPAFKRFQRTVKVAYFYNFRWNDYFRLCWFMRSIRMSQLQFFASACDRGRNSFFVAASLHYARIQRRMKRVVWIIVGCAPGWMTSPTKKNVAGRCTWFEVVEINAHRFYA